MRWGMMAMVAALALAARAADEGLLAHWAFDEGVGEVARDLTGNGFDATINGPVFVPSPRGHALRFDGEDDIVTYATHPEMLIEGDLTLLVWVKTDSSVASKTNRLLIGDTGAGVYRNLSLRLGPYGHLRFEWANETSNANLLADAKLLDGTWKHVAVVCDCGAMQASMYVDGHRVAHMRMPLPISKVHYRSRVSGRFYDGCLKGEIDDIKIFNLALPEAEVLAAYRSEAVLEVSTAQVRLVPRAGALEAHVAAAVTNWTDRARTVSVTVSGEAERGFEIGPKQSVPVPFGRVDIEPLFASRNDLYALADAVQLQRVKLSTALGETVDEQFANVTVNPLIEALRVDVEDPWIRELPAQKTPSIRMTVHLGIAAAQCQDGELLVTVTPRHRADLVMKRRYARPDAGTPVVFDTAELDWGAYDVTASFRDRSGRDVVTTTAQAVVLPDGDERIVVLNNLVSELLNAQQRGLLQRRDPAFMNPRDGWCFFSVAGAASVTLAGEGSPLAAAGAGEGSAEAMRLLPAGRHTLSITGAPTQVIVRAIPALVHNVYPTTPGIRAFGPHTWARMSKYTLPNCNMIESHTIDIPECDEWLAQGRHWIMNRLAAWLDAQRSGGTVDGPAAILEHWRKTTGFGTDRISGMQVDEYGSWGGKLIATARSAAMLAEDPGFAGKLWIPFVAGSFHNDSGRFFIKTTLAAGWPFSIERYIGEMPTEEQDREHVRTALLAEAERWESTVPGCLRRTIFTLMYAYLPYCTTNRFPTIDFRAHLEMQMQVLATDPAFFGLWGVQPYRANYVDEEILHWMGMLLRHYAIEGRTDWLLKDPYALTHVADPDFTEGLKHWRVAPAEDGSISAGQFEGYGTLEGRYPWASHGNTFLVMKRSGTAANTFGQTIRGLTPGRVYSMKLITGDYGDLEAGTSEKRMHALAIRIEGAEVLDDAFQYPFYSARGPKPFTRSNPFHMNYHWRRFRAKGATAELTVSDWKEDADSAGPAGQQLMVNFIEIQPYLDWD